MATDAEAYFSQSYGEAREAFLAACAGKAIEVESIRHPDETAPDGGGLYTDVAWTGPEKPNLLVGVSSGTHGLEGFCGSACQAGMLREGVFDSLPDGVAVMLVHAMNPYGFAHLRRVNEDNVDLNRNFVDHEAGHYPDSSAYSEIHALVAPPDFGEKREEWAAATMAWIADHGLEKFQAAVSGGQYEHPDGLFYGGRAPVWSNRTWTGLVRDRMAGIPRVRLIDIHTGLGPYGHGEKLGLGDGSAVKRARAIWGDDVTDLQAGASVSAIVTGDVSTPVYDILPAAGTEPTAMALEFGTTDPVSVLGALQVDNWLHMHGGMAKPGAAEAKREVRDAFYADRADWKRSVFAQAKTAVEQALKA